MKILHKLSFGCRFLVTAGAFLFLLTGGLSATSAGNFADAEVSNPELLWPISINIPHDIAHFIHDGDMASVILRIDGEGKVIDWISLDLPHIRLFESLDRALRGARFSPAMIDGEPVMLDMVASIPVGEAGYYGILSITPMTYLEGRIANFGLRHDQLVLSPAHELDEPLRLINEGQPVAYEDESGKRVTGSVMVDFHIDHEGRPHIIRSDPEVDSILREAAHLTVEQFQFSPPQRNRHPTVVKARMMVQF